MVLGGAPLTDYNGYFIEPTIIKGMSHDMLMTQEETFAPVVGLYKFETTDEVIALVNDCDVGLDTFICTESTPRM